MIDNKYRNCKDVYLIDHGDRADPELYYNGEYYNYWQVEDALWYEFLEANNFTSESDAYKQFDKDEIEDKFDEYVRENIYDYLNY